MLRPIRDTPSSAAVVPLSGTPLLLAEKENLPLAAMFCVEKFHVPAVRSKPLPESQPMPLTEMEASSWKVTNDPVRLNVKPSTCQNGATTPELNIHGAVNTTASPGLTIPANAPSAWLTFVLVNEVTPDAAVKFALFRVRSPVNVMLPVMGAAWAVVLREKASRVAKAS